MEFKWAFLSVLRIILILSIEIRLYGMDSLSATAQNTYIDGFISVSILAALFIKHMVFELQLFCMYLFIQNAVIFIGRRKGMECRREEKRKKY